MSDPADRIARAREVLARVEDIHTRAARSVRALDSTLARSAEVRCTATSPDGTVRATVDSTGLLTDLELPREVPAALARQIVAAIETAAAQARGQVRSMYMSLVDEGTIAEVPQYLPLPPRVREPTPAPAPASAERDDTPPEGYQRDAW